MTVLQLYPSTSKYSTLPMFDAVFIISVRSVYKELHPDHETGAADNK